MNHRAGGNLPEVCGAGRILRETGFFHHFSAPVSGRRARDLFRFLLLEETRYPSGADPVEWPVPLAATLRVALLDHVLILISQKGGG